MQEIPTMLIPVVALALVAPDGRVCLQQRPRGKAHGGLWEFPGGKVEPGETCRGALVREIAEELGTVIDPGDLIPVGFADQTGPGASGICILLYASHRWEGEVACLEGDAIGWFAPESLVQLPMPPLDYPLARALCAYLHEIAK